MGGHLYLQQPEIEEQIASDLKAWAAAHRQADALEVFQKAGADRCGAGQADVGRKATSYIFHADEILQEMPNVRLIYLVRNPFDLSASVKRRRPHGEHVVGSAVSWRRGVETAMRCQSRYPGRVHIIRYENLVSEPERQVRRLCTFLGKRYDDSLLEVPLVNTSDRVYEVIEGAKGMDASRMYVYMARLTPAEIVATQMLCPAAMLQEWYPELPHGTQRNSLLTYVKAALLIAMGMVRYPMTAMFHARRYRFGVFAYMALRIKAAFAWGSRGSASAFGPTLRPTLAGLVAVVMGVILALSSMSGGSPRWF